MTRRTISRLVLSVIVAGVVAGSGLAREDGDPQVTVVTLAGAVPSSPLVEATGIAGGDNGDLYVYEGNYGVIRTLTAAGAFTNLAGTATKPGHLDGQGENARISAGGHIVRGGDGTLYFAETSTHTIRKVSTTGLVTTIAGFSGQSGSTDAVGSAARFFNPRGIAVNSAGVVYVAETGNDRIRRIAVDGTVTTLAGSFPGAANGTGTAAQFRDPNGIALSDSGDLIVTDSGNHVIRRVTTTGETTVLAGAFGLTGATDGTAGSARFFAPNAIINVGSNTFLVSEGPANCDLRLVTDTGETTHHPSTPAGGCALSTNLRLFALARFAAGQYAGLQTVTNTTTRPGLVSLTDTTQTTRYATTNQPQGSGGTGSAARFELAHGFAGEHQVFQLFAGGRRSLVGADGTVRSTDSIGGFWTTGAVQGPHTYSITTCQIHGPAGPLAGSPGFCGSADGTGTAARFQDPRGIAVMANGTVFVADTGNHTIRKVTSAGVVTTLAGEPGVAGSTDGNGGAARFNEPYDLVVTNAGDLYVADTGNHTIRRVTPEGDVTTLAGVAGSRGGDDGTGTAARFNTPAGIARDDVGVLYVADFWNHTIRQVTSSGVVTTLAGSPGAFGSADGTGDVARFREPRDLVVDHTGAIYVADSRNHTVRVLLRGTTAAPAITTQPTNQSTTEGVAATFSIGATGTPTPGYRWQRLVNNGTLWDEVVDGGAYNGAQSATLRVNSPNASEFNGARYRCIVGNAVGSVTSNEVTLTVNSVTPSPNRLWFTATKAGAAGDLQSVTPPQAVRLTFASNVPPNWTATSSAAWIEITGGSGTGNGTITVGIINPGNVIGGSTALSTTVVISAPNATITRAIDIVLNVNQTGTSQAPVGAFDTPLHGSTGLSGAIVVSGWALDDVGVDKVEIWRDLVAGESTTPYTGPGPGNGKVFIANGQFGSGTRPDVENLYGNTYPLSNRGGWGYMLLTYGLPDRDNGTYVLHAFAYDGQGQHTALGRKTISVDNNAATKPFGTIDTPDQGGTVSGMFTVHGWALTPNVNGVPTCTFDHIVMELDSNQVYIPVTYGVSRPDVSAAFPGYSTSSAPGAIASFDTSTFTNGLHTIGWLAYDTCGRGEGIGSRFITVQNNGGSDPAPRLTRDLQSVGLRAPSTAARVVRMDTQAYVEIAMPEVPGAVWTGYELVGGEARRLPIGSTLEASTGRFFWKPAPGFLGSFELRFVAHVDGQAVVQSPVRIIIGPSVRLALETPTPNSVVPGVFNLSGWAADLGAAEGTGIDAVHVWAYPHDGGDPLFAGHATLGVTRQDVAAVYGTQFGASGWQLTVASLPTGGYDLVVFPHSSVTGTFVGAKIVRVYVR